MSKSYSDFLGENLDKSVEYVDYISENLDKSVKYSEYLAENLDKSISYSEYLADNEEERIRKEKIRNREESIDTLLEDDDHSEIRDKLKSIGL